MLQVREQNVKGMSNAVWGVWAGERIGAEQERWDEEAREKSKSLNLKGIWILC